MVSLSTHRVVSIEFKFNVSHASGYRPCRSSDSRIANPWSSGPPRDLSVADGLRRNAATSVRTVKSSGVLFTWSLVIG